MKEEMKDIGALTPRDETKPTIINGVEFFCALPDAGPWKLRYYKPLRTIVAASQISGVYLIENGALVKVEPETRGEANPPPQGSAP